MSWGFVGRRRNLTQRPEDGALEFPAGITPDGMMIIGDHYPPGMALDPARVACAKNGGVV